MAKKKPAAKPAKKTAQSTPVPEDPDFVAEVLAWPEDDSIRLAAADWFDDHQQPEGAELIRLQIDRAKKPQPESYTPSARETELLNAHAKDWLCVLPE